MANKNKIKSILIEKHRVLVNRVHVFWGHNVRKIKGKGNVILANKASLKRCRFNIIGDNNVIIIDDGLTRLSGCVFSIYGSNNRIAIHQSAVLTKTTFWIEDDANTIEIGDNTSIYPHVELAVIEGTSITIGRDCLFSSNITFRTGDSHSILDVESGLRINKSRNIIIGEHVWIGNDAKVLKGADVGAHSIISTGAIVTGRKYLPCGIIAGVPAKTIKTGVSWDGSRKVLFKEL